MAPSTRVRFNVSTGNFNGTVPGLTFRAWDQTSWYRRQHREHPTNGGGTTSFSTATATSSIVVNPVNDTPSFTIGGNRSVAEDAGAQSFTGQATSISPGPANESGQAVDFIVTNNNNALFSTQPAVSPTARSPSRRRRTPTARPP